MKAMNVRRNKDRACAPSSKTGIGMKLRRPSWMTKQHADEEVIVPVDVRGVDTLKLITNKLEMFNRVCLNMRLS